MAGLICIISLLLSITLPSPEGIAKDTVKEITQTIDQITEDPATKEINRRVNHISETVFTMLAIASIYVSVMGVVKLFV